MKSEEQQDLAACLILSWCPKFYLNDHFVSPVGLTMEKCSNQDPFIESEPLVALGIVYLPKNMF
jgi:hypothetical protein